MRSSASFSVSLRVLFAWPSDSALRTFGRVARYWAGATLARASKSSSMSGPASAPPPLLFSARQTPRALLRSSEASRVLSPGRGPMVPKTGSMWNCAAECITTCSASSILPTPVWPSSTMTPPSASGPGGGLCGCVVRLTTRSPMCRFLRKPPPSHCCTWLMPFHDFTLQRSRTFRWYGLEPPLLEVEAPPNGASCQGKRTVRFAVSPICMSASFFTGWKTGTGALRPRTLTGCSALKITSLEERFFVSSSQRIPRRWALFINLAAKLTQSPSTVYSILRALPQSPQ
mmetsp:Transcript_75809/g.234668  ORF Transcript_75809/g.234668 Transcript_75809/m.234668 type:complete len:287 (-) Transcript_75809:1410-2270(-)